jgi:hypothetical protein
MAMAEFQSLEVFPAKRLYVARDTLAATGLLAAYPFRELRGRKQNWREIFGCAWSCTVRLLRAGEHGLIRIEQKLARAHGSRKMKSRLIPVGEYAAQQYRLLSRRYGINRH